MKKSLVIIFTLLFTFCYTANWYFDNDLSNYKLKNSQEKSEEINQLEKERDDNYSNLSNSLKVEVTKINNNISSKFDNEEKLVKVIVTLEKVVNKSSYKKYKGIINAIIIQQKLNLLLKNNSDDTSDVVELKNKEENVFKVMSYNLNNFTLSYSEESIWSSVMVWDNELITNAHVIWDDDKEKFNDLIILCKPKDFSDTPDCKYIWKPLRYDKVKDIAYLEIEEKDIFWEKVPTFKSWITFSDKKLSLWEDLDIYGYPSIGWSTITFTKWKISGSLEWKYKTDASVDHGSSWWWVFDSEWKLVWIVTSIISENNTIWYIIPKKNIDEFNSEDNYVKKTIPINQKALTSVVKEYLYETKTDKDYKEKWLIIKDLFEWYKESEYDIFYSENIDYINIKKNDWYYISINNISIPNVESNKYFEDTLKNNFFKYSFNFDKDNVTCKEQTNSIFTYCYHELEWEKSYMYYTVKGANLVYLYTKVSNWTKEKTEVEKDFDNIIKKISFYDFKNTSNYVTFRDIKIKNDSNFLDFYDIDQSNYYPDYLLGFISNSSKWDYLWSLKVYFSKDIAEKMKSNDFSINKFFIDEQERIKGNLNDNWMSGVKIKLETNSSWIKYIKVYEDSWKNVIYYFYSKDWYIYYIYFYSENEFLDWNSYYAGNIINSISWENLY